jgi:hypothetical protein
MHPEALMALQKSKHPAHSRVLEQLNADSIERCKQAAHASEAAIRRAKQLVDDSREAVRHAQQLRDGLPSSKR